MEDPGVAACCRADTTGMGDEVATLTRQYRLVVLSEVAALGTQEATLFTRASLHTMVLLLVHTEPHFSY